MKKTIFSKILFLGLLLSLTVLLTACSYGFKTDNKTPVVDDKNSDNLGTVAIEEETTKITIDVDLVDNDGDIADVNVNTVDTDNDGISDNEEENVYNTDPLNSDTDGDGYLDGQEIRDGYDPNGTGKSPEGVLADYIDAAKIGDYETYFSLLYYSKVMKEFTDEMISDPMGEEFLKESLMAPVKDLSYQIKDREIRDDLVVFTVSATKNGRLKSDRRFFLTKEDNAWKINKFGLTHPADVIVDGAEDCSDYCGLNVLFDSSNIFNTETQECFCMHEAPQIEDLTHLYLEECEQTEKNYAQNLCYIGYAITQKDESYCEKVSSDKKDSCYFEMAVQKNDETICDYMWDDEFCLASFIGNKKILELNEECGDDLGVCAPGLKCAYPCGIEGCSNSCLPEDELERP